jgi:hypothetical protein
VTLPRLWQRRRLALGLSPIPGPGVALLLVGVAIGPKGVGALSDGTLDAIDPLISLALAALGVFVGLDLQLRGHRERLLLAAGSLEAGITIVIVAGGYALASLVMPQLVPELGLAALLIGVGAASSSTGADQSDGHAARMGDLDDILPILIAGLVAIWVRTGEFGPFLWLMARTTTMAVLLAVAAVLLVRQTGAAGEQRVFTIGSVLLLGGIAAYLGLSALAAGLCAGFCWNLAGTEARDRIVRDLRYVQHPLTVALLIVAGARLGFSTGLIVLLWLYVALRTIGKLLGSYLSQRIALGLRTPLLAGLRLAPPGVVGIAIALEALRLSGRSDAVTLLSTIVGGGLVFELLSVLGAREDDRA